ncbi:MAG: hypothetical protein KKA54_14005 [Proteobacteria bacterium]|nr:hypothetical protein [Pseudomonadota bacterium]
MNIFLTIDVETYTGNFHRDILGYGNGLPFILETCRRYDAKATFFVEALAATRWGIAPLQKICSLIIDEGHDIQLHLHPKVAEIKGVLNENDKILSYNKNTQKHFIEVGLEILANCGVKSIKAFRAGDLAANEDTLLAMEECGLFLSSNRDLDQKSSIHSQINHLFPVVNELSRRANILDLPVTIFKSCISFLDGKYRHFEICALGLEEMKAGLSAMQNVSYENATILTHPGEFFGKSRKGTLIKNGINCQRLDGLLKFISENMNMNFMTVSEILATAEPNTKLFPIIQLTKPASVKRLAEQILKRHLI